MMMGLAALLLALGLLAIDMRGAHAHGYLASPLSRNMHSNIYDSWDTKEYTPNQLFAGGEPRVRCRRAAVSILVKHLITPARAHPTPQRSPHYQTPTALFAHQHDN